MLCRDWNAIKLKNSNSCVNCKSNQAFNDLLINGVTFTSTNTLYCITINIYDLRHNIYIYRHISCSLFITFTPYTHSLRMSFTAFGLVFSLPCFVLLTIFSAQCRDFFFCVDFLLFGFDFAIYFHFITFTFIPIHFQFYSTFSEERHCYRLPKKPIGVFTFTHTESFVPR